MKILMLHRQPSAVGAYRSWYPARLLRRLGYEVTYIDGRTYHDLEPQAKKSVQKDDWHKQWLRENLGKFDLLIVDRSVDHVEWGMWAWFRHYSPGCRMVVDFDDDFTDVPEWNKGYKGYHPGQEPREAGLNHLRVAEMVTVSTEVLRKKFEPLCHNIALVLNRIDPADWEGHPVNPDRASDPCLRILYGGADGHFGDIAMARSAIEGIVRTPPVPLRLICLGALPYWMHNLMNEFPARIISLPWAYFEHYPSAVAWGGFDLAIAPLADHPFNLAKSNIKWLEAGIQQIPFVCSKVGPYASIPEGCAIRVERPDQWEAALCAALEDSALRQGLRERAYQAVCDEWTIDHSGETWQTIVETALSLPRIERLEDTRLPGQPEAPALAPTP